MSTRHALFLARTFGWRHGNETQDIAGAWLNLEEIVDKPLGECRLAPTTRARQLGNENAAPDWRLLNAQRVEFIFFLITNGGNLRKEVAPTTSMQLTKTSLTAVTAPGSSRPLISEDPPLQQSIHVVVTVHDVQTVRTQGKPLVGGMRNLAEEVGGIIVVGVENDPGFDVQTVDAARRQIRRAHIRSLPTTTVAEVNRLGVIEAVGVAHDSEESIRTRQTKNVHQGMHCGSLRLAVIGTHQEDGIEVSARQARKCLAEYTEHTGFEETGLPSNSDDIRRQYVT